MKNSCLFLLMCSMISQIFSVNTTEESTMVACDLSEEIKKNDLLKAKKAQLKEAIKNKKDSVNVLDKTGARGPYYLERIRLAKELSLLADEIREIDRELYITNRQIKKMEVKKTALIKTESYNDNVKKILFETTDYEKNDNLNNDNDSEEQDANCLEKNSTTGNLAIND